MQIFQEIKEFFKGDVVFDDRIRTEYSTDASLLTVRPEGVLFPKDSEDIEKVVQFVKERKKDFPELSLTARAAGTDMTGGPLSSSLILDVSRYMKGTTVEGTTARALPGTMYRDFEQETLSRGLFMPGYPASKEICAIGGMVANNAGGEKTLLYGKTDDYVRALSAVLSDGNEYRIAPLTKKELEKKIKQNDFEGRLYKRTYELVTEHQKSIADARPNVSKNSSGYALWDVWDPSTSLRAGGDKGVFDLTKLFVGSQGTLGIITEVEFDLVPTKDHSRLVVFFLKDLKHIPEIVDALKPLEPESVESFDDHTLRLAIRFFPEIIKQMKIRNFLKLAWSFLPEVKMVLTGGIPRLIVLVEFCGNDKAAVEEKARQACERIEEFDVPVRNIKSDTEAQKYWTMRRESFNLLRKNLRGQRTAPFIEDVVVHPDHLPEFLPKLTEVLERNDLLYTIAGHVADGNFHIIPLMDMSEEENRAKIDTIADEVYDLVREYDGSISGEHNDGIIRTPYLDEIFKPEMLELFERVKEIFDPDGIFNPGKKTGGSVAYMEEHLVQK